jgi:hypothetical protein
MEHFGKTYHVKGHGYPGCFPGYILTTKKKGKLSEKEKEKENENPKEKYK